MFEVDYINRIIFHTGKLVRVGKEAIRFISQTKTPTNKTSEATIFLKRSSVVWFSHKWHKKGSYKDGAACIVSNKCPVGNEFEKKFKKLEEKEIEDRIKGIMMT